MINHGQHNYNRTFKRLTTDNTQLLTTDNTNKTEHLND